jgi:uncharacterized protein
MAEMGEQWVWGAVLVAMAAGIAIGVLIGYFMPSGPAKAKELGSELDRVRSEYEAFRGDVNQHFQKTSDLFQDMTVQYRAFYEHLATGAHALCAPEQDAPKLDIPDRLVLGAAVGEVPEAQSEPADTPSSHGATGDDVADAEQPAGDQPQSPAAVQGKPQA